MKWAMPRGGIINGLAAVAVLALAGWVRLADLGHTATRADELNMLNYAGGATTLTKLWTDPPWLNQIPLVDSIPVVWARLQPGRTVDEAFTREPFALLGLLTVVFCTGWMRRRRGLGAGLLLGLWLALLPFHVYHSREAYYYVVTMFFAAGMLLRGADFMARLRGGGELKARQYGEWTVWTLLACLAHMSAWAVAGIAWLLLLIAGWRGLLGGARRRHGAAMAWVAVGLAAGMSRWIFRAFLEMQRTAADPMGHIGADFGLVGPRVLPFFVGGANGVGVALLALLAVAALWNAWRARRVGGAADPLYRAMSWLAWGCLVVTYAYVFGVGGGGKGKLVYFAVNLPAFLCWAVMTLDRVARAWGERRRMAGLAGLAILLAAILAVPVWHIMNLDGKPTPYRLIRDELDSRLAPGDVVLIDRWLEPWNEMTRYAPTNVTVSFTVPDEPYEQYVALNWRPRTQTAIQQNGAQGFLRLARNHAARVGLWTWPEKWFAHRVVLTNAAGVWLRDTGFAPMEEFYTETSRVEPELFYSTRHELAERAKANGQTACVFFGEGWRLFKPWQQGDFTDYRILEDTAGVEVHNVTGHAATFRGEVTAAGNGGSVTLRIGEMNPLVFPPGQLSRQTFTVELSAGVQQLTCKKLGGGALVVRELRLSAIP